MNTLRQQVEQCIRARALLREGEAVLVAVSGGLDSMVLLHLLHELASTWHWILAVAHLNHRLRGRSSDADEHLVRRTARQLGLPFAAGHIDVRRRVRTGGVSLEMAARTARHEFLARAAARRGIASVALGHHADDQVELFFLRLFRGSGSEGLAGMKWRNRSPVSPKVQLVRPLLGVTREQLREFALERGIRYREDASNQALAIQRNRIRHRLLPMLRREYQPALDQTVARVMDIARAESDAVMSMALSWLDAEDKDQKFEQLPVAVQRRCVQLQLLRRGVVPDYDLVERLRRYPGQPVSVSQRTSARLSSAGTIDLSPASVPKAPSAAVKVRLEGAGGHFVFGGLRINWLIGRGSGHRLPLRQANREVFDASRVGRTIVLRHWRPGDRFQPIGMKKGVKLQDLFTNLKIPRARRRELAVATTAEGEVFWVENLRISERFKLTKLTNRRLHWRWNRL